ncbi:3-hydroxyisobutyrate dehydrogenase [Candidatus Rhodobacter oscarellae]|uniref:3-hydroxyisobutyrate dehydrogenase n=1 Tax=Candidatus Rhodobacter oscarellae TaxID=1675527 RepID=A0A0J9E363_9RHOB|nr:NAD(P)-dependent oxidoreductase [Candidatus Rhodobacter lobularis]KMW56244.1 3-hydroxyisobutyrate dehydrogenase [Candidatus Rhodobacter lobularis]
MSAPKIGFIGLGLMGAAMVGRLQDKGYALTVLGNRNRAGIEAALARGASEAGSAKAVAEASDIVMLCVGTSDQVEGRMRGAEGVIAGLSAGKVVIDFGTSLPDSTIALGAEVAAAGAQMLDAPLGRTPMHAKDGLLNIMGSGDRAAYDQVKPVLDDLGENVFHLGALGTGHKIKLMNNFFSQCVANAMAEAFAMADKTGVDKQAVFDVINAGPNSSPMMDFIRAYACEGNPNMLAFSIKNALKDVGYYRRMAEDAGAPSVMAGDVFTALTEATQSGQGEDMVPQMFDFYAKKFGA